MQPLNGVESTLTSEKIVSLLDRKQALRERRIDLILAALERAKTYPTDLGIEDGTGDLVATPEAWAHFEDIFAAFQLELPQNINAHTAIGSVIYLAGHLGSKIKQRARNERLYRILQSLLTPDEQEYIESLFGPDIKRPAELIKRLGVLNKLPSDFA